MPFFFTLLDDSLRPKGSRDPLGLEHIWSLVGRRLIGNLTTVTGNLDNFIATLIGSYLAGANGEEAPDWERFQRYEQILAHSRYRRGGKIASGILGSRLIGKWDYRDQVILGSKKQAEILSSQRQSGLWGIYSSALCATGLTDASRHPTETGADLAAKFLEKLSRPQRDWLVNSLTKDQIALKDLDSFGKTMESMLYSDATRRKLLGALLNGTASASGNAWQEELHRQAANYLAAGHPHDDLRAFFGFLSTSSDLIGDYSRRVMQLESILILARRVFDFLLIGHGTDVTKINDDLRRLEKWPDRDLLSMPDFHEIDNEPWRRRSAGMGRFAQAVRENEWAEAVQALLDHHAAVMQGRGGPPWVFTEADSLKVIFGSPGTRLPTDSQLDNGFAEGWDNSYFVSSYLSILRQETAVPGEAP